MRKTRFYTLPILGVVLLFVSASECRGSIELGIDATFAGTGFSNVNLKTHNSLLMGSKSFGIGPMGHYNRYHEELTETILGGGIRIGSDFYVMLEGGHLRRTTHGKKGSGFAGALFLGTHLISPFRISVPLFFRVINNGLVKRWRFEALPYVGLEIHL